VSLLEIELRALRTTDPEMNLLTAVEYITPDPGRRVALYRRSSAEVRSISGMGEDDACLLTFSPLASDCQLGSLMSGRATTQ
jgi:hypothetical protein